MNRIPLMNRREYSSQNLRSSLLQSSKGYHSSGLITVKLTSCIRLHTMWTHGIARLVQRSTTGKSVAMATLITTLSPITQSIATREGRGDTNPARSNQNSRGRSLVSNLRHLRHDRQLMHDKTHVMSRARSDISKIAYYDSLAQKKMRRQDGQLRLHCQLYLHGSTS